MVEGRFVNRLNRFAAMVELLGEEVLVHVANSGRMRELLIPGQRVLLRPVAGDHRKCKFDLALVDLGFTLASADARLPNALVSEALREKRLSQFLDFPEIRREVSYGESRLDLMLEGDGGRCYIETKSVTLVEDGTALFPDAPTTRGTKHLRTLTQVVEAGHRAAAIFVVQRQDARDFSTFDTADPEFAAGLRAAMAVGVEAYAYGCRVTDQEITLADPLPFKQ
ncbi:MAG: DNA/RNA nuclease SfsA [Dehalococcoidia bacterium]